MALPMIYRQIYIEQKNRAHCTTRIARFACQLDSQDIIAESIKNMCVLLCSGGEDYFANYTKFCFGVGSVKGDVKCCKVKIINDCLVEGTEKFTAHATVRVKKHNVTDQDCGQSGDGDRRHDNSSVGCNGDGGQEGEDSVGTCTGRNRGQGTANDGGTDGEGRCGRRGGRRDGVEGNRRRNNRIDTNTDNNCENEGDVIDDSAGKSNDEGNNTDCDAGRNNDEGSGEEDDYNGGRDGPPLFGGSLNSRTGSIDIFIDDDDSKDSY